MIAAYLRVSTKDQKNTLQRAEISTWLKSNGHALGEVEWFEDTGSGADASRPEFERLQKDDLHLRILLLCSSLQTGS